MSEKVYGVTKNTLECEIHRYEVDNILKNSVPVVSIEWLKEWCKNNNDYFFKAHHDKLIFDACFDTKQKTVEEKG